MITGSIYVPLPELKGDWLNQASADRRALQVLDECPDGAVVIVDIGQREFVTEDAARWLHQHDHRLQIDIRGSQPIAVARFITAARAGTWSVVA